MKTIYNFKGKKKKELVALMKHQIEVREKELEILDGFLVPQRTAIKFAKDFLAGKASLEAYLEVAKKTNDFYNELGYEGKEEFEKFVLEFAKAFRGMGRDVVK